MGVVLGLLAGITYGAADFIGGLASRRSSTLSVVVISQLVGLIILLALLPLLPRGSPTSGDLVWGALAGVAGAAGITLLYRGLAIGRMSVISPITAVIGALIPFSVGLALHERPSPIALAGVAIALVAVILVSSNDSQNTGVAKAWVLQPGLIEALFSGVSIGAFYVFLARSHAQAGLWPLGCARATSFVLLTGLALARHRSLVPQSGSLLIIAFAGLLDMTANAFYLLATYHGLLAIVAVLASLYPASTVVLARVILKEKLNRIQFAGVGCALVAIGLLASGK